MHEIHDALGLEREAIRIADELDDIIDANLERLNEIIPPSTDELSVVSISAYCLGKFPPINLRTDVFGNYRPLLLRQRLTELLQDR